MGTVTTTPMRKGIVAECESCGAGVRLGETICAFCARMAAIAEKSAATKYGFPTEKAVGDYEAWLKRQAPNDLRAMLDDDSELDADTVKFINDRLGISYAPFAVREQDALDFPHDESCPKCGRRQWTDESAQETCQACGYELTEDDS